MPVPADPLPPALHLGAHRTGGAALAAVLRGAEGALAAAGWAAWTAPATRDGRLRGLMGDPARPEAGRARGRLALRRAALAEAGRPRLLICDPALLGGLSECLALARLYPTAGPRLRRLSRALGPVGRVTLCVRALDEWWTSLLTEHVARGGALPPEDTLAAIAEGRRGWRRVVESVAEALPEARIDVWAVEGPLGDPVAAARMLTGVACGPGPARRASPGAAALEARLAAEGAPRRLPQVAGRMAPFGGDLRERLRMLHRSDMVWLRDGADGMATFHARGEDGRSENGTGRGSDGGMGRPRGEGAARPRRR